MVNAGKFVSIRIAYVRDVECRLVIGPRARGPCITAAVLERGGVERLNLGFIRGTKRDHRTIPGGRCAPIEGMANPESIPLIVRPSPTCPSVDPVRRSPKPQRAKHRVIEPHRAPEVGGAKRRQSVISTLDETLALIERVQLQDLGCAAVDISLLASTLLTRDTLLWTMDKHLGALAARMGVAFR